MITKFFSKSIAFFTIILVSNISTAQINLESSTFTELPSRINEAKMASISIEKINKKEDIKKVKPTLLGSGFLASYNGNHYAITCNHIVEKIARDELLIVGYNFGPSKIFIRTKIAKTIPQKDVAILFLAEPYYVPENVDTNWKSKQKWIQPSLFSDSSEIVEGGGVLIIGYPLGLGSEYEGNHPLSRIGIVAHSVSKKGTFIIDGISSRGNSGSPIFSTQSSRLKLLGIVTAWLNEQIYLYDDNTKLVATLPYNSGLTLCISSVEILKILKSLQ